MHEQDADPLGKWIQGWVVRQPLLHRAPRNIDPPQEMVSPFLQGLQSYCFSLSEPWCHQIRHRPPRPSPAQQEDAEAPLSSLGSCPSVDTVLTSPVFSCLSWANL